MKHEISINRSLRKRNPLLYPGDPVARTVESEAYDLGCDARNDFRPIDENPYDGILECLEYIDWAQGWADADRMLDDEAETEQ